MASESIPPTPESDEIWNRATWTESPPPGARAGDRALHDALEFDGYVMNGGLDHALDVMGHDAERAAAGWAYLGRDDVAELLREALRVVADMPTDREERQTFFIDGWSDAQAEAIEAIGDRYEYGNALEQAFLRRLRMHPEDFAPPVG